MKENKNQTSRTNQTTKGEGRPTMKTTNRTTFENILRTYEKHAAEQTDPTAYANALTELATAVAYSVLKKCITVSQNPMLIQARQSLAKDLHNIDRITYANENAYKLCYTDDGYTKTVIVDKNMHNTLSKIMRESFGDGLDLVNDAVCAILSETEKAKERTRGELLSGWMEIPYQVRSLKKKVWIKKEESVNGWEMTDTTAIQEVYKAVRRAIAQSRAAQADPSNGYTYLADISTDPQSGTNETIYRRFAKYADIGGAVTDYNGHETAYTADRQTADDIERLVAKMNLTAREAKVLSLRQSGYGYKAIATYMGISIDNAKRCGKRLKEKAEAIGLTPSDEQ